MARSHLLFPRFAAISAGLLQIVGGGESPPLARRLRYNRCRKTSRMP
jgi:hypothetical protein